MSGAIWDSYADAAMDQPCPNCRAGPDTWCTRPDGRVRRTPCIARIPNHQNSEGTNHDH